MQTPFIQSPMNLNRLQSRSSSYHICTLTFSILFIGSVVTVIILAGSYISASTAIIIAVCAYLVYLGAVIPCNTLNEYLSNVEEGHKFAAEYEEGRQVQGEFILKI